MQSETRLTKLYNDLLEVSQTITNYERSYHRDYVPAALLLYCDEETFRYYWKSDHYYLMGNSEQVKGVQDRAKLFGLG